MSQSPNPIDNSQLAQGCATSATGCFTIILIFGLIFVLGSCVALLGA